MLENNISHRTIEEHHHIPVIGKRIVKSAIAVFICLAINLFRDSQGIPFYSAIATILCMQPYVGNSFRVALDRICGTLIGAFYGCIILLAELRFFVKEPILLHYFIVACAVVLVLYTTVLIKQKNASYIACVAFLSVTITTTVDISPFLFAFERIMDTFIGIAVALLVNVFKIPRKRHKGILFISALDETLVTPNNRLTDFSKVLLNQLISDGANFTVSTARTPASLMIPMKDVDLKLPVIAANGALLYDLKTRRYVKKTEIPHDTAHKVIEYLQVQGYNSFTTSVVDDVLLIYYGEFNNAAEKMLYEEMRLSPYRNYIYATLPQKRNAIYIMVLEKEETLKNLVNSLKEQPFSEELFLFTQPSEYEGYDYLKIYDKSVSRRKMMEYLKKDLGAEKLVTFGSIEGVYDYVVHDNDTNTVIKNLAHLYAPYFWKKEKKQ